MIVAVSGGPDSLCLLHVLRRLRGDYGVSLHVAHLDHRLRIEAAAEATFVAGMAKQWGLPYTGSAADIRALARAEHRSIEEAARLARYRFLAGVANEQGAQAIAVGHNADDQVETVLMHCLRGSGLAGLRGMRRRDDLPQAPEECGGRSRPLLIRPLLDVPRAAIEAYCLEHDLQPRCDRSNLDRRLYRNRIRHELVPTLETYNPRIRQILHHTADLLSNDYDYLQQALAGLWPELVCHEAPGEAVLWRDQFQRLAPSMQRAALRRAVSGLRRSLRDLGWAHVEQARLAALTAPTGTLVTLPAGLVLEVSYGRLIIRPAGPPPPRAQAIVMAEAEMQLVVPGTMLLAPAGWAIASRLTSEHPPGAPTGRQGVCLDADKAGQRLQLRTRKPGDRFQPFGMAGHHKSVKEYMIDAKIPRAERDRIPLLVSERGILWIAGWVAGEVAAPGPETQRYLCLELIPPPAQGISRETEP